MIPMFVENDSSILLKLQKRINDYAILYSQNKDDRLHQAMRYSLLGPGKRLRPLLVYATASHLSLPDMVMDKLALAVELVHCYSLVHDDLPALDNDDYRRGQLSCHKQYDEATAILVTIRC